MLATLVMVPSSANCDVQERHEKYQNSSIPSKSILRIHHRQVLTLQVFMPVSPALHVRINIAFQQYLTAQTHLFLVLDARNQAVEAV